MPRTARQRRVCGSSLPIQSNRIDIFANPTLTQRSCTNVNCNDDGKLLWRHGSGQCRDSLALDKTYGDAVHSPDELAVNKTDDAQSSTQSSVLPAEMPSTTPTDSPSVLPTDSTSILTTDLPSAPHSVAQWRHHQRLPRSICVGGRRRQFMWAERGRVPRTEGTLEICC